MEPLILKRTDETPEVILDKEKGIFKFAGRSLPEDVNKFYNPIREWISEYIKNPNEETVVEFDLEYFNSSSARIIVKLLIEFEKLHNQGKKVKVIWKFSENDDVMEDRGEEIKSVLMLPFEMQEV